MSATATGRRGFLMVSPGEAESGEFDGQLDAAFVCARCREACERAGLFVAVACALIEPEVEATCNSCGFDVGTGCSCATGDCLPCPIHD